MGSDRCQAIIWTNDGILLIGPLGTNFSEILIEIYNVFIQENAFENVVCEMVAILSRFQCVKMTAIARRDFTSEKLAPSLLRKHSWNRKVVRLTAFMALPRPSQRSVQADSYTAWQPGLSDRNDSHGWLIEYHGVHLEHHGCHFCLITQAV